MKIGRENQTKARWVWTGKQNVGSVNEMKWNSGMRPYENYFTDLCAMSLRITGLMDMHPAKEKQESCVYW